MAKIKFGMMMTDASGKLGGQVFSKNRGGNYVRTKGIPTNPQTTSQMGIRGIFASISSAWSSLAEAGRLSFNNFVSAYATTDIFGDLRNPSGKALFQKLNQNLSISLQPLITACVSPVAVPFAGLQSVAGGVVANALDVATGGDTAGCKILVFATPQLSQGTSFVKNKMRLIFVANGGVMAGIDIFEAYTAKFGALVAGANVYVGLRVINANGQASPLETIKAVISA